ncbi:MAG: hypothetical protein LC687_03420, partial [Actinobacteria bacterium]|nr:hypothetical protein [Actinomycetota bacterium]
GLRTGLSVHAATGGPVLVTGSAGNMNAAARPYMEAHVPIETVRDKVPGVGRNATLALRYNAIVIGADNDALNKDGTTRQMYENTGLVFANRLANAAPPGVLCVVTSPKDGKDWYDVLRDKGMLETAADYKIGMGFVDYNYAFARKPRAWELVPGTRYLSKLDIKPGINLVRSPIGTGKTHALIELLAESSSYLYSVQLQSLARNAAARLGCKLYSDKGVDVANEPYLSICLNSLPRLLEHGQLKPYEYFILDEFEQYLQRLTTDIDNKKLILESLEWLILNCEHVVLMDAQLGKLTKAFLSRLGFDIGLANQITNNYRVGTGRKVKVYGGANGYKQIMDAAISVLNAGGRAWISANSKKEVSKVHAHITAVTHKKGLEIKSDNSGDIENKAFFANVNVEQAKYDFIVTSPSTNTGVSIDSVDGYAAFD